MVLALSEGRQVQGFREVGIPPLALTAHGLGQTTWSRLSFLICEMGRSYLAEAWVLKIALWTSQTLPVLKSSALVSLWSLPQGSLSFLDWTCCWPRILHVLSSHCTEAHPQGQALQTAMRQKLGLSAASYRPWEFLTKFSNFIFTRIILSDAVKTFTVFFSMILMEMFNRGGKS